MTQTKDQPTDPLADLVHEKSAEILFDVGFCVPEPAALLRLKRAGFPVDDDSNMVRLTPDLLEDALDGLNRDVTLYDRAGATAAPYRQQSCFMGAGTPVNVFDLETSQHRPATRQDVRQLVTLQDALPQVDIVRPTVTATDQGDCSDLVEIAELLRNTGKPIVHRTLSPDRVDAAAEMLAIVAGGQDAFRANPNFATLYCPISPGYFTPGNIKCMLRWARYRVPITLLSMAMGGASAPATLLGELVVINTDNLAWIVALQTLYPGTPLLYGSVSAVLDMKTGLLPLGAPERGMINSGAAMMARYYGLPSMCGGLSSDAKELDAQAGFEKAVTAVPLLQEKASIIYGVGAVDAGNTISYLQMILDDEIIAGLRRMIQGITRHDLDEEVALIKANTPRGNFLKAKHTRRTFGEHWLPAILSRDSYETWKDKGQSIEQKCRDKARWLVDEHIPPPLTPSAESELERIVRRQVPDFHF
ncbi:MAG: trimethylamine methyltransferase family protein [Chloroflexota bacterium]|nr:MAG: trimethylamine methyltransferase family protein [Chloroflexota bacterium]